MTGGKNEVPAEGGSIVRYGTDTMTNHEHTARFALISVTILCALSAGAGADAPSWRGTPGSTFQEWRFDTNANPSGPESVDNAFGTPSAAVDYEPPFGTGWKNTLPAVYGSAQGWWDIARGSIVLSIIDSPNIAAHVWKDIQVQVTYWQDINMAPSVGVTPSGSLVSKTTRLVESGPVGGAWYADTWLFHVDPAAGSGETVTVAGHPNMGSQIDKIVVDTRYAAVVGSAAQARALPEQTVCELSGPVVTRSFDTFFYLEDLNRASGIRVNCATGWSPPAESTAPKVSGVLRVIDGERVIDQASVEPGGSGSVLPLGMCGRAVACGLSPQGLLVRLWGRAHVPSPGAGEFLVDDGSGRAVRVRLHGTAAPTDGAYIGITGVLGADSSGPVLRAGGGDIATQMD